MDIVENSTQFMYNVCEMACSGGRDETYTHVVMGHRRKELKRVDGLWGARWMLGGCTT
jgi:hypothetical protein